MPRCVVHRGPPGRYRTGLRARLPDGELARLCRHAVERAFVPERHADLSARYPLDERPDPAAAGRARHPGQSHRHRVDRKPADHRPAGIHEALTHYRGRGFQIAIDDLGEGFANLRMWSELRPEFVKIDKHFVHGIARTTASSTTVRAMQDLAGNLQCFAGGRGNRAHRGFRLPARYGHRLRAGYFIARPQVDPSGCSSTPALSALTSAGCRCRQRVRQTADGPDAVSADRADSHDATNEIAMTRSRPIPSSTCRRRSTATADRPDQPAQPDRPLLPGRSMSSYVRAARMFMEQAPLVVDQHATLQELAMMLALAPGHYLQMASTFIADGRYQGVGSSHDLMARITEMQISAARCANPLTSCRAMCRSTSTSTACWPATSISSRPTSISTVSNRSTTPSPRNVATT